jgi:hypothetical protein
MNQNIPAMDEIKTPIEWDVQEVTSNNLELWTGEEANVASISINADDAPTASHFLAHPVHNRTSSWAKFQTAPLRLDTRLVQMLDGRGIHRVFDQLEPGKFSAGLVS